MSARIYRWSAVAAMILLTSTGGRAQAELTKDDVTCRKAIGISVKKLANALVTQMEKCHQGRMLGAVTAATDCSNLDALPANLLSKVAPVAQKLNGNIVKSCGASTPAALGYVACPDPCGHIDIASFENVASCMVCLAQDRSAHLVATAYGTPPTPGSATPATSCQQNVGKASVKYLIKRMATQQACQWNVDRGKIPSPSGGCQSADLKGAIAKALAKANGVIASCTSDTLAGLNSCASDVSAEQSCIHDAVMEDGDALFNAIYFPGGPATTPTFTSTPTSVPQSTATDTPTAIPTATPTEMPTASPTAIPTDTPTEVPTSAPSATATDTPTAAPTSTPTPSITATTTATPTPTSASCSLVCQYGGTLDAEHCTCQCPDKFTGNQCQDYDCFAGNSDFPGCSLDYCQDPYNIGLCPQTCLCNDF